VHGMAKSAAALLSTIAAMLSDFCLGMRSVKLVRGGTKAG
jgi:hypothetical protein